MGAANSTIHPSPLARLNLMLWEDRRDLAILLVYTIMTGLFALAIPLASQALVNTIAAGVFLQPLIVLTVLVFVGMVFRAILRLLKLSLVERLQQRIFARVAVDFGQRLPRIRHSALVNEYPPELVNRFFDVLTIQKTWAKLLLDGLSAVLQVVVGLTLMAFYSPILLAFDVLIILFVGFVIGVLGIGGLRTSIAESVQKYRVAEWLEDIARCQTSLKINGFVSHLVNRVDDLVIAYIKARQRHFRVTFRQAMGSYFFQAFASAGILAIGGWLVINRQLTLGQLVAAELIVVAVLSSLEKIIKHLEDIYDLLTGLDKVGHVIDLPLERSGGKILPITDEKGVSLVCRGLHFSYATGQEVISDFNLELQAGDQISLVGASGAGKSTIAALLCALYEPSHGTIEINGYDIQDIKLDSLRQAVAMVADANEIFEGTIEENILVGRDWISHEDVRWALSVTQLTDDITRMPQGLKTKLVSAGANLSRGQIQRLLIARAIVDHPQLLILDEAFSSIDERTKLKILDEIFDKKYGWTIIDISHDPTVIMRTKMVYVMGEGKILEFGTPKNLTRYYQGEFLDLFPTLLQTTARR
jgi:ABC-type bacteriocin/lantibiotic exporter with double-glycine peptidase domain